MCKELCGHVYDDYRAGLISWKKFSHHHQEQVLAAMRSESGGPVIAFLDYRDGSAEVVVREPACEFCGSKTGPILTQDMGEGRTMQLCPRCREYIAQGERKRKEAKRD